MYQGKFEQRQEAVKKSGPGWGSLTFYLLFFLCILLFWIGTWLGLNALRGWLSRYEAAQPDTVCQAVFDSLFSQPDWGSLYERAEQENGTWEGKAAFVSAMEAKVGQQKLTCMETSAGLSGDKKYIVRLEKEKIASFTLEDHAASGEIPDWRLGMLEFHIQGQEQYFIRAAKDCHVFVNGREVGEEQIAAIRTPLAQEYLPVGTNAPEECTWQITGLLAKPEVLVTDSQGQNLTVTFEEESRTFTAEAVPQEIGREEREIALNAVKTYGLFMVKRADRNELAKYFNKASDTYQAITGVELYFVQDAAKREFIQEQVTDYCRYSENLFSVRVSVNLQLTRKDGSVKDNVIDQSLFFSREAGGKWLCYAMTAVDVSETREQVRLTFRQGEQVLSSEFVDAASDKIQCPQPQCPTGKAFVGWTVEEPGEDGQTVLRLVFQPDEAGMAAAPADGSLLPMELSPLFE